MLSRRLSRCIYSQSSHQALGQHTPIPFRSAQCRFPSAAQRRAYRPINYRHFLTSWNTLRLWIKTPLFYYNVAGVSLLCGLFYYSYLERVPVSEDLVECIIVTDFFGPLGIWAFTLQHRLLPLGGTACQEALPTIPGHLRRQSTFNRIS
jgi:hypothetical protein